MSFNTGNELGSLDERDLYDNAINLDKAMNSTEPTWRDRFNVEKPTIDAALKSAGFMPAGFDFVTGGTLQPGDRNKAVYNPAPNGDNNWYRWNGVFPKEIAANSQPNPKDKNNWVPVLIKTGVIEREALRRTYQEVGLNLVSGSFEEGGTLNTITNILLEEKTGKVYSWSGGFPKVVSGGTLPESSVNFSESTNKTFFNSTIKPVTWSGFAGGADPTGAVDAALAFQAAVAQTAGQKIYPPLYASVPQADFITIRVPTGKYLIGSKISPKGKNVVWECDIGVSFVNVDNLCGRVVMKGVRINTVSAASLDSACGFSVSMNRGLGKPAAVMGIGNPADVKNVTERDSVGFYAENSSTVPTLVVASATYTSSTAIPTTPADVSQLIAGMIIDTDNGHAGVLASWAADGSSLTVKNGWYVSGAAGSSPVTPPASGFKVNMLTKVWAMNSQTVLTADGDATRAAGFELGLRNHKQNLTDPDSTTDYLWGYDAIGFGPFPSSVGYIQRGGFLRGFESSGAMQDGFAVSKRGSTFPVNAVVVRCNSFHQFVSQPNGVDIAYKITNAGDVDMGGAAYAGTKTIRLRSSGLNNDHDTRIQSIGGAASPGQGTLRFGAAATEVQGNLRPVNANSSSCGTASRAWANVFSQTAVTVLSDETHKTSPLVITDAMLDAWSEVNWVQFKYLDRVEAKGEDEARWHFGVIAQRAVEAFARHGLDAHEFGFLCYDEWDDKFEDVQTNIGAFTIEKVKVEEPVRTDKPVFLPDGTPLLDADGKQITTNTTVMTEMWVESQTPDTPVFERIQVREAGSKYGIRYEEALVLEAALQRRNYKRQLLINEQQANAIELLVKRVETLEHSIK